MGGYGLNGYHTWRPQAYRNMHGSTVLGMQVFVVIKGWTVWLQVSWTLQMDRRDQWRGYSFCFPGWTLILLPLSANFSNSRRRKKKHISCSHPKGENKTCYPGVDLTPPPLLYYATGRDLLQAMRRNLVSSDTVIEDHNCWGGSMSMKPVSKTPDVGGYN